ncbi:MAG: protein-methionine-sulfoxide reductase catalytic subunit MsrP [Rhodospirillales bacterium]|nr:protein-methionine-sulfoxide reductase catalytic subunit MsrP [Rhodospirillales bacterium]MSP79659.1 protein-methionine-sulfoxide reductase catalytic subunit MsrP [Rhodospirillales bacterium]
MLIKHVRANDPSSSEITPRSVFADRRRLLKAAAAAGVWALAPAAASAAKPARGEPIPNVVKWPKSLPEMPTAYDLATTYNNFYEFGFDKDDPARHSSKFKPRPWTVKVEGHAEKTGTFDLDDLIKPHQLEERVYRFRCVEAWSMVVPWVGVPLGDVLKKFGPTAKAKYVAFQTVLRPEEMPGQRLALLKWPYVEGLRLDEAMHPLALLTVGMYGELLPNQNGAPLRLMLPWKYGFKSIKSIVRIAFVENQPPTSWNIATPSEYGFYSNVNPRVDHPRWTQATERRLGDPFFSPRRPTPMFNGYADEVAHLYAGMDLAKLY